MLGNFIFFALILIAIGCLLVGFIVLLIGLISKAKPIKIIGSIFILVGIGFGILFGLWASFMMPS
jgi:hypothetical protein